MIPWSPLARGFLAGNRRKEDFGETVRAKTDEYAHEMYYQPSDFAVVDRVGEVARAARRAERASGAGLDSAAARRDRAHHRRQQDAASGGRRGRAESEAGRGRMKALAEPYQPHRVLGMG